MTQGWTQKVKRRRPSRLLGVHARRLECCRRNTRPACRLAGIPKPPVHSIDKNDEPAPVNAGKRHFVKLTEAVMFGALAAAYGGFAAILGRFLYPARPSPKGWMFVANVSDIPAGESRTFHTPAGESVNITRLGADGSASDFVALSSVCPHLGCQVHWEAQNDRYFCPCHNGVFSPDGVATSGPPADAGQSLAPYPLKIDRALLFIEVALADTPRGAGRLGPASVGPGPGHDPCLGRPRGTGRRA